MAAQCRILKARSNVSTRQSETAVSFGFLFLGISTSSPQLFLGFMAKADIASGELQSFRTVAAQTRTASSQQLSSSSTQADHIFTVSPRTFLAPVDDIALLVLEPVLTLTPGGDAACLVRLSFDMKANSGEATEALPVDLWFERDEQGRDVLLPEVVQDLERWLAPFGKGMRRIEQRIVDGIPSAASEFEIVDAASIANSSASVVPQAKEWPISLPISQDSLIYKMGAFGIGVAAAVVGPTISNKVEDVAKNTAWDVLERFTRVKKQVVEHPLARPILSVIPAPLRSYIMTSAEAEALLNDYDSAAHYLAQWAGDIQGRVTGKRVTVVPDKNHVDKSRDFEVLSINREHHRTGKPISAEQWIGMYDEVGRLKLPAADIKSMVFYSGLEDDVRCTAWKYLLNLYPWESSEKERMDLMQSKRAQYNSMKSQWKTILLDATAVATANAVATGTKVDEETEALAGDEKEDGDVVSKMKERRYRVEKDVVRTDRSVSYYAGSEGDERPIMDPSSIVIDTPRVFSKNLEMLKDVLITYTIYDFELGYVQGMNDLLSPLLVVMDDEVDAFWDQSGMRRQLYLLELLIKFVDPPLYSHLERIDCINLFCCFRWLLVLFKREFEFEDILRLWEVHWACPFTKSFHLFVALAIINKHRQNIMTNCLAFDECLKYMNDLSGHIDLEDALRRAEVLFDVFRQMITIAAWERLGINIELGLARSNSPVQESPVIVLSPSGPPPTAVVSPKTPLPPALAAVSPVRGRSTSPARSVASSSGGDVVASVRSREASVSPGGGGSRQRTTSASPSRNGSTAVKLEVDIEGLWELLTLMETN